MEINNLKGTISDNVLSQLSNVIDKFKIDNTLRLSHFLAQAAHESNNFQSTIENLNYSAEGLVKTFSKYFPTIEIATPYARNSHKIANKVYANRMGNGDENSGDGWKFRGKGYIQLTGKNNHSEFDKVVNDDILANPDLIATNYPLLSAAWFWDKNKLNLIADKGATDLIVTEITKKVNGGNNGLLDRIEKFKLFYHKLNLTIQV